MQKRSPSCFAGLDVSKDHLEIACRPEDRHWRVATDCSGVAACLLHPHPLKPTLPMLEATGGWQGALVAALATAKAPVAVVTPRQVRDFATATGQLAKTDALDAGIIAHVADAGRPTPRPFPDATTPHRAAVLQRRRQLLERLVAECHLVALAHPAVRDSLARHLEALQRLLRETAEGRATVIRSSPAWRAQEALAIGSRDGPGAIGHPAALPE